MPDRQAGGVRRAKGPGPGVKRKVFKSEDFIDDTSDEELEAPKRTEEDGANDNDSGDDKDFNERNERDNDNDSSRADEHDDDDDGDIEMGGNPDDDEQHDDPPLVLERAKDTSQRRQTPLERNPDHAAVGATGSERNASSSPDRRGPFSITSPAKATPVKPRAYNLDSDPDRTDSE